jgi:hypothetical protein
MALHFGRRPKPSIDFIEVSPVAPVRTVEDESNAHDVMTIESYPLMSSMLFRLAAELAAVAG